MLWLLVHGVHLLLVVVGLVGVGWLLLPQLQVARLGRRTSYQPPATLSEHEERVAALRAAVESGTLATPEPALAGTLASTRLRGGLDGARDAGQVDGGGRGAAHHREGAPRGGGTGLGLFVVRALAEAQGGSVTYAPRDPQGSTFTLTLPAARQA